MFTLIENGTNKNKPTIINTFFYSLHSMQIINMTVSKMVAIIFDVFNDYRFFIIQTVMNENK